MKTFSEFQEKLNEQTYKHESFKRVVSQWQGVLANTKTKLEKEGLKKAKSYFASQSEEFDRWVKENVDETKVNVSPILDFGKVKFGRDAAVTMAAVDKALAEMIRLHQQARK